MNKIELGVRAAGHGFRREVISVAVERLAEEKRVNHRQGPRKSDLYSHRDEAGSDRQRGLDWDPLEDWEEDQ